MKRPRVIPELVDPPRRKRALSEEERALWQQEKAILMATFGRSGGFAFVKGWNAANEEERRRFLDELRNAEEARCPSADGTEAR